jgi:hypothetical protein
MSVTFRCKCGRWIRLTADEPLARCPNCLRTVSRPTWLWWGLGSGAAVLALVMVAASVWPRATVEEAQVELPAMTPTTSARLTAPTAAKPTETTPPVTRPTPPAPPTQPAVPHPTPSAPALVPDLPRVGKLVVEPAGKYKEGDTFVQQVTVVRSSSFGVLGIVTTQAAEYLLTSKLEVTKVNADGSFVVTQTVQIGKLHDATADMKQPLTDALKSAEGAKFELAVGPNGKVTALKGLADPVNVKLGRDAEQQTLRLWSILDADAWKELAGMTFFQPDKPGLGMKWNRDFTHDWGALGSWLGRTDYATAAKPEKNGQHKVDYVHAISHRPAKGPGNLPFTIKESAFPRVVAGGTLRYDAATNRVAAAEELFHVRGGVVVSFGGTDATVEVEEQQKFRLTASEVKPRELIGQVPKK